MNCADFEALLNDEFDASSSQQAADLAEHAAHCATCRATREGFRLLSDSIGAWRDETPDADLVHAVVFALRPSTGPAPQKPRIDSRRSLISMQGLRRHSPALAIAGAAALFAAAVLLPALRQGAQPEAQPGAPLIAPVAQVPTGRDNAIVSQANQPGKDQPGPDQPGPVQPGQIQPGQPPVDQIPYYDLAQRAAGALGQMTMLVLPVEAAPQVPAQEPPAERPAGWMDEFERELKPVGRGLGNAFDFLWRAGESVDG